MISVTGELRRSVSVDGVHISYQEAGSNEGRGMASPIVLIHGAFENGSYFGAQVSHLAVDRRVIAVDLRAHGESDRVASVSVEVLAHDVIAVCEDAGVEAAVLCGHSILGAAVALAVAAARPDLVRAIAMLDAVLFPPAAWRDGIGALLPVLQGDRWLEALRGYLARTLDVNDPPTVASRVMGDLRGTRPEIARSVFASFLETDFEDALRAITCPLLYVHAKAPADLGRLAELRPDALIGQVVGSGHYLMLVVPEQVNAMLDRFLDLVGGEPPSLPAARVMP